MDILEKIDSMRKERGWSINYLAMEAMLTQSTVNNMFTRKTEPWISTLRSICDAFGITMSEFFAEDDLLRNEDEEILRKIKSLNKEQRHALLTLLRAIK